MHHMFDMVLNAPCIIFGWKGRDMDNTDKMTNITSGYGNKSATLHSAIRTSPKGEQFIGECLLCGKKGLTAAQVMSKCENIEGKTEGEALILAISGGSQ